MNIHLPAILGWTKGTRVLTHPQFTTERGDEIAALGTSTGAKNRCRDDLLTEGWLQPWKRQRRSDPNISDWWWFQKAMCVHILYVLQIHNYIYTYYISLLYNKHYINFIGLQMGWCFFFLSPRSHCWPEATCHDAGMMIWLIGEFLGAYTT